MELWYYQEKAIEAINEKFKLPQQRVLYQLPTGGGKCLAPGTGVILFDGRIAPVEDVCVGDQLMGPNSKPRTVTSISSGHGPMVEITPVKGNSWMCNDIHILSLVKTREYRQEDMESNVIDVGINEWKEWSTWKKHIHKLFRVSVEFDNKDHLPVHPYLLGLLLGDGGLSRGSIHKRQIRS